MTILCRAPVAVRDWSRMLKATFQIADRSFKGVISPEAFERYTDWKQMTPIPISELS
jgi:hypothetical protein